MKQEILVNTQLALFFEQSISRPDELWQQFNTEMNGIFDQIPLTVPVPNEIQLSEVPVVQMNSGKGVYSCNIARGRVDFFHRGVGKQTFSDVNNDFLQEIEKYFNYFSGKTKIKRIGFVARFFIEDNNQDKTIAKLLNDDFKKLYKSNTHEAFIRYVIRTKIMEFDVNDLTVIEKFSASISEIGDNIKGVLITRDFNTIPEENYSKQFKKEAIKNFVTQNEGEFKLEKIKKILWPT